MEAMELNDIAEMLCRNLISEGFIIQRYDAYSSNSIYLKLDYGVCNSIRISDHPGKKYLKYRYNIGPYVDEFQEVKDKFPRIYYRETKSQSLLKRIIRDKSGKLQYYGKEKYKKLMEENKIKNMNSKGFWSQAELVDPELYKEEKRMSKVICIAGESGSGKTTSMRNLDPKSTYYIDADKKGLSWKGWRKQYNKENKNYLACDDANVVRQYIKRIAEACPGVKVIVVDTINGLMVADEMRRSKEKGYDKWVDLAACVWDLVCEAYTYREDLTIIFTAHTQTDHDEDGYMFTRIKTSGKKLDKICLESKFTTVLLSKCVDGSYKFETQANNSTAKSPMGAFDQMEIDNDIVEVMKALEDY